MSNGSIAGVANAPAVPGETLLFYGSGFGDFETGEGVDSEWERSHSVWHGWNGKDNAVAVFAGLVSVDGVCEGGELFWL